MRRRCRPAPLRQQYRAVLLHIAANCHSWLTNSRIGARVVLDNRQRRADEVVCAKLAAGSLGVS